ncbi:MAG: hypothetical protein WC503_03485 [Candidatus Shapirobacteria bacterium]
MGERASTDETDSQLFRGAMQSAVKHLRDVQPDIILCLGDSTENIAGQLTSFGFNVTWLNHDQGHTIYQDGSVDDQTQRLKQIIGNHQNPMVFEDTMISGGKLWQLHNTFESAEIPFQAVVLAAPEELIDDGITIISTNPKLISEMRLRVSKLIDSRNQ